MSSQIYKRSILIVPILFWGFGAFAQAKKDTTYIAATGDVVVQKGDTTYMFNKVKCLQQKGTWDFKGNRWVGKYSLYSSSSCGQLFKEILYNKYGKPIWEKTYNEKGKLIGEKKPEPELEHGLSMIVLNYDSIHKRTKIIVLKVQVNNQISKSPVDSAIVKIDLYKGDISKLYNTEKHPNDYLSFEIYTDKSKQYFLKFEVDSSFKELYSKYWYRTDSFKYFNSLSREENICLVGKDTITLEPIYLLPNKLYTLLQYPITEVLKIIYHDSEFKSLNKIKNGCCIEFENRYTMARFQLYVDDVQFASYSEAQLSNAKVIAIATQNRDGKEVHFGNYVLWDSFNREIVH